MNPIGSKRVVNALVSMNWATKTIRTARHSLLTSDRPVIMTNGLDRSDAHIVLPISPCKLFIATKTEQMLRQITTMEAAESVWASNNKVAEQAYKYVYGVGDSQMRFVANRLGKRARSSCELG